MKLKDIEVNFSFSDADDLERLENSARKVKEKASKYEKKELSVSEAIREECKIINDSMKYLEVGFLSNCLMIKMI